MQATPWKLTVWHRPYMLLCASNTSCQGVDQPVDVCSATREAILVILDPVVQRPQPCQLKRIPNSISFQGWTCVVSALSSDATNLERSRLLCLPKRREGLHTEGHNHDKRHPGSRTVTVCPCQSDARSPVNNRLQNLGPLPIVVSVHFLF